MVRWSLNLRPGFQHFGNHMEFICQHATPNCPTKTVSKKVLKNHSRLHRNLQKNECNFCGDEKAAINIAIAEEEASENRDKIVKQFKFFSENPETIVMQKMCLPIKISILFIDGDAGD